MCTRIALNKGDAGTGAACAAALSPPRHESRGFPRKLMRIREAERMLVAKQLVQHNMRVSLIHALTNLSQPIIREIWREIHNEGPRNGPLPESILSFVKTAQSAAFISSYIAYFQRHFANSPLPWRAINAANLISSVNSYRKIHNINVDINAAYYAIRDINSGIVEWKRCHVCRVSYIYSSRIGSTRKCPFCAMTIHHVDETIHEQSAIAN
jgi:hypothetical protein